MLRKLTQIWLVAAIPILISLGAAAATPVQNANRALLPTSSGTLIIDMYFGETGYIADMSLQGHEEIYRVDYDQGALAILFDATQYMQYLVSDTPFDNYLIVSTLDQCAKIGDSPLYQAIMEASELWTNIPPLEVFYAVDSINDCFPLEEENPISPNLTSPNQSCEFYCSASAQCCCWWRDIEKFSCVPCQKCEDAPDDLQNDDAQYQLDTTANQGDNGGNSF